ncbi:MAG: hypothetical protein KDK75_22755, partial [Alphaproteobacteria bacterium]|nr:hypothetical protein [Alphaproteobacteria bacterium]
MTEAAVTISRLLPGTPELEICARWRHEAFLDDDGFSLGDSRRQLETIAVQPPGGEMALIAHIGTELAGICMLVDHELEPAHDL